MLQRTLIYIFSALPMLGGTAMAQDNPTGDSLRNKFLPTGLRVGTDMISLVRSAATEKFQGWEVNADVDFYRFYLAADYGAWSSNYILDNGKYTTRGQYYRIGVDVNFLLKDTDRNMFFLGLRHGHSNFNDHATLNYTDKYFGTIQTSVGNENITANWKELITGLRVKIWKMIWMGYTARLKFALNVKGEGPLKSYEVPGYGLSAPNLYYGFNYQVFIMIPALRQR